MKLTLFVLFFIITGCQNQKSDPANDDYVLVEFASKLEEDYSKLNPENSTK